MAVIHSQPIIIRKSFVGLVLIYLFGIAAVGALGTAALYLRTTQADFARLLLVMALMAAVAAYVQGCVYNECRMVLTDIEVDVANWTSITNERTGVLEWNQVQDVELRRGGILALIFGYGTLIMHAANDQRDLVFTMTPRAKHWRDYMAGPTEGAVTPVHDE
jgi:hypothetical protein